MRKQDLKENSIHGTQSFPLHVYSKIRKTEYHVSYHWHDELEFILVEEGVLNITLNSEIFRLEKGDFIFINSGDLHEITSTGTSIHHAIVFHPKILDFDYPDISQNTIIKPITKGDLCFPTNIQSKSELGHYIGNKLKQLISISKENAELSSLSIKICLLQIISALYKNDSFYKTQSNVKEKQEKIKTIILYIQENYSERIYLEDLAELLSMNKNYFSKYFHEVIGKTPINYINEYRCEKAAEMLKKSDFKVLEISLMVGFDNFSYFIRKFKQYKNDSPTQFRKIHDVRSNS